MNFIAYRDFGIISWPFSLLFAFLLFKKQMPAFSNSCNLCEFSTSPLLTAALGWKYLWGAKPCDPCSTELCQQKSLKLTHYPAKLHFSQVSSHNPFIILLQCDVFTTHLHLYEEHFATAVSNYAAVVKHYWTCWRARTHTISPS